MGERTDPHVADPAISPCTDARGLAAGTRSRAALAQVEDALAAMLSYFGDPVAPLERAIAQDPQWAHPRVLLAALLLTMGELAPARQAAQQLAAAAPLLAHADAREQAHGQAAQAAAAGDWEAACRLWDAILQRWPTDIAALLFAHLFDFYRGDAQNLRRRPQRVLPRWSPAMPLYGFVLGMYAFGLEESGDYAQAEDTGRAALALNRRDPWSIHAVAHVHEMRGEHAAGARWLAGREHDWAPDNALSFHNWFHVALFQLEAMDTAGALATYDAHLAAATDTALQRVDGTAVLWRLRLLGVDTGARFAPLHAAWQAQAEGTGFYVFNDLHALLAAIGAGAPDAGAVPQAVAARPGGDTNRQMVARVGAPLLRAFAAYARGRWSEAARGLLAVRDQAHAFGGSHAQRDLLSWSLMDAAARAGDHALAGHVLCERWPAKRDTPLTAHWQARFSPRGTARPGSAAHAGSWPACG